MDQQAIERVQRRATKIIPKLRHYSYQERLQRLSLPSLTHRRLRGEMIFLYQLTHQYFNIDITSLLQYQSSITRGHCYKIYKPHAQTFCRANFFTVRTINDWNNLPVMHLSLSTPTYPRSGNGWGFVAICKHNLSPGLGHLSINFHCFWNPHTKCRGFVT